MLSPIGGDHVKDIVGFEKDGEALRGVYELHGIRGLHGPRISPRQAARGIVESRTLVQLVAGGGIGKRTRTLLRTSFSRCAAAAFIGVPCDVCNARLVPYSAEVRFAIREAWKIGGLCSRGLRARLRLRYRR